MKLRRVVAFLFIAVLTPAALIDQNFDKLQAMMTPLTQQAK
jgi:hypothetical protein